MEDHHRRQMLEDNVVAVPHGLENPILDQRRRQRVVLPLKAADGSAKQRQVYLPIDADPSHPGGVGLVITGLKRRPDTQQ
eukprot:1144468-Alexandrium_andersonii.AAC.1